MTTSGKEDDVPGQALSNAAGIGERLDRVPLGKFHTRLLAVVGAGLFLDGFELYLTAGVLGDMTKSGWSSMALNANFISFTFFGMVIGAWMAGALGDRFGRRFTYQFNLLVFGIASLAAFFAPSMQWLIALRFIMGIGLGSEVVVGYAMLTEFVPAAVRGRMVGWLAVITNSSLLAANLLSWWIIPSFGWRYMFLLVGVGAVVVWAVRKSMPESPRWLESRGRIAEADAIVAQIEGVPPGSHPARPALAKSDRQPASLLGVFSPPLLRLTLLGMLINIVIGFSLYGFISWLPTFLVRQGFTVVASIQWTLVMSVGAPVGAVIGLYLADAAGRRLTIVAVAVLAALFGALFPSVGNGPALMVVGFCLFTMIYVLLAVAFAIYVPELFPTELRMRGAGVCSTVGRLTTAFVQYAIVALFAWGGLGAVVGTLAALLVLLAGAMLLLGIETAKRPLEEISATSAIGAGPRISVAAPEAQLGKFARRRFNGANWANRRLPSKSDLDLQP